MSEPVKIDDRQLGDGSADVLESLSLALGGWVIPFIRDWMGAGAPPNVGDDRAAAIRVAMRDRHADQAPPPGYGWLPELMGRLATSLRFNRRNFINIHPTPHVPSVLASAVVALQNPNNIVPRVSGATSDLEKACIAWMAENLLGFDPGCSWGNVVGGGTIANMTALLVARDYTYNKLSRPRPAHVRARGLYDLPPGVVLATAGSHYSIRKALWLLGMGDENVITIPVAYDEAVAENTRRDETFIKGITDPSWKERIGLALKGEEERRTELDRFYRGEHEPFSLQPLTSEIYKALYGCFQYNNPLVAYVFTIGTTDTGTIELPEPKVLDLLYDEDVYIHADAAAGGFALLSPRVREQVRGLERVHSATVDGHKLGYLPYPNGAVLFREPGRMYEILHDAPYLKNLAPTLEGSRPGTHVAALWAAIQDLGASGYQARLARTFAFVDRLVASVKAGGSFQLLHKVDLTTVAIAPRPRPGQTRDEVNEWVTRVHQRIDQDLREDAFLVNIDQGLSGIKVRNSNRPRPPEADGDSLEDIHCLRIVAANPEVEPEDADALVAYLERELAACPP